MALEQGIRKLEVSSYSLLFICKINGEWQTKDEKLVPYREDLEELIQKCEEISFTYMSREKNANADALDLNRRK